MGRPDTKLASDGKTPDRRAVSEPGKQIRHSPEAGFATLLIVLLLTVLSFYGMESYVKANGEMRMAKRETKSRQAVYLAESGVEWAKAQLTLNPNFREGALNVAGKLVTVTAAPSEGGYWVTSVAEAGSAKRKIGVLLQNQSGHWQILRYQELHQ